MQTLEIIKESMVKYATAKTISSKEFYNNEYTVLSLHDRFDDAYKARVDLDEYVIKVTDCIQSGDSINEKGKYWRPQN